MTSWPKQIPPLTSEQAQIADDFMKYWHEVLPSKYGLIQRFNHGYPAARATAGTTVEIGAGLGEHIRHEDLNEQSYTAVELRPEMAAAITREFPTVKVIVADCQEALPFDDHSIDRVLAIHVLEHLPNLPAAIREVHRILKPTGRFQVCIPCEGGIAYWLARKVSTERIFRRRYGMDYSWFIKSEHINFPSEIFKELHAYFTEEDRTYFPLQIPLVTANLVIGIDMSPLNLMD